jgi:protein-S-isoprenylcysteine O-methyltransferase Ste14
MHRLELMIPPPIVFALAAGLAIVIEAALPSGRRGALTFLALAIAVFAILIDVAALWAFRKARTTINPRHPDTTSKIVTYGVYGWSRNPMYVGLVLLLTAVVVWLGQPLGAVAIAALALYLQTFQIEPEERILEARFGTAYTAYREKVRRWV